MELCSRNRSYLSVALILSVCVLCLLLTPCPSRADERKIKVGIILPLSGDSASTGAAIRNGITIAYEELTPESKNQLQLIFEDDASVPTRTVSAFNKLRSIEDIDILVTTYSGTSKSVAPLAEAYKVPLIAIATDPEIVRNRSWVVNFWVTPEEESRMLIPEALRRGYKNIARITLTHPGPFAFRKAFDDQNRGRINISIDEEYQAETRDFRPYLTKLRAMPNLDAILVILLNGQCGVFAKQAREMGLTLPLFNYEIFEDAEEARLAEGALVGQWYVNADDPSESFLVDYRSRFPGDSLFGAGNGHDVIILISEAMKHGTDRESLNRFFHTAQGVTGVLGVFSASGDNRFTLPAANKVVTENGFKKIS